MQPDHIDAIQGREPRFKALVPFFIFLVFYFGLSVWAGDFYRVPMPTAFLTASAAALLLDRKRKLAEKVEIYARGMGNPDIMIMCLIFILAGAFAASAKAMGAVDSAVSIARYLIPGKLLVAGIFIVSCFISLAIGSGCGTIAALTPIAAGLINASGVSPAIMIGAVIGGAMFGDNMSMISDTTIAATRTQQVSMHDKFFTNLRMILPAALATVLIYVFSGHPGTFHSVPAPGWKDILTVLPYVLVLVCALAGMNVMALLFCGTILTSAIGIISGSFNFWKALGTIGEGTLGMSETLIVAILAGGLLRMIRHNGGIDYLMLKIGKRIHSARGCEFGVFLLTSLINLFTANNTVAIVIAGPVAREFSLKYGCSPKRIASILDTASCAVQGLIPYGAQVLIAVGVAKTAGIALSSLSVIQSLYYPFFLAVAVLISIFFSKKKS